MKKYEKPMILLERFELSQNIADCAWELNSDSKEVCTATADYDIFGSMSGTLFSTGQGCTYKSDDGYEDYCYQAGAGSPFNVFKS